jgi:hypothetical protein
MSATHAGAVSISLGYFINKSGNDNLDYLEKIFPNSFASTLKNKYDIDIIKPNQLPFLTEKEDPDQIIDIGDQDLLSINEQLDTDYFVYGYFKTVENNRIKLFINIFKKDTKSVFHFQDTGFLETEMFKLIDKISVQIKFIATDSMIYKNDKVEPKSRFAIITNIEGEDLNCLYYEFMAGGYKLSSAQGNELYNIIDYEQINKLYHVSGINASYHLIHNKKEIELWHGTWSGNAYYKKIMEEKKTFEQYAFNYKSKYNEFLKKLYEFDKNATDYVIIIGFDEDKTSAWMRCLTLKDNRLIVTQTGIEGSSVNEISKKIIQSLTTGLPADR